MTDIDRTPPGGESGERVDREFRQMAVYEIVASRLGLFLGIISVCLAGAIGYLLLATPVFRVQATLVSPMQHDVMLRDVRGVAIASMKLDLQNPTADGRILPPAIAIAQDLGFEDYAPEDVFEQYLMQLQSRRLRRDFFDEHGLYQHYLDGLDAQGWTADEVFDRLFNKSLVVHQARTDGDRWYSQVSFEFDDPSAAAELLNEFVMAADRHTVRQLFASARLKLESRVEALKDEIRVKRELARRELADEIVRTGEAAKIAEAIGLETGIAPTTSSPTRESILINTVEAPPYLRGEKALRAELSAYENRKEADAFVPDLRIQEALLDYLSGIEISLDDNHAARLDQPAFVPQAPQYPRRALTLTLALAGGTLLGLFATIAHHTVQGLRRRNASGSREVKRP